MGPVQVPAAPSRPGFDELGLVLDAVCRSAVSRLLLNDHIPVVLDLVDAQWPQLAGLPAGSTCHLYPPMSEAGRRCQGEPVRAERSEPPLKA